MALFEEIIEEIYKIKNGIVILENHFLRAPLKFLIDNAEKLKQLGVEYLFTEKFCSDHPVHSQFLSNMLDDKYIADNIDNVCSGANRHFEKRSDWKSEKKYTMPGLINAMRENDIQIVGISSNKIIDKYREDLDQDNIKIKREYILALNAHMAEVIKVQLPNTNTKWLALVGSGHGSTFIDKEGYKIAGLAEKLSSPSLFFAEKEVEPVSCRYNTERKEVSDFIQNVTYQEVMDNIKLNKEVKIGEVRYTDFLCMLQVTTEGKRISLKNNENFPVSIMVEKFYKVNNISDIYICLIKYCQQSEEIKQFFQNKELKDYIIKNGHGSLLHLALIYELPKITKWLITKNVDLNAKDEAGATPLHLAASKGNIKIARLLLENGANYRIKNNEEETPTQVAEKKGKSEIVKLIQLYESPDKIAVMQKLIQAQQDRINKLEKKLEQVLEQLEPNNVVQKNKSASLGFFNS